MKYMILARRYVQEGDERIKWCLDRLQSEVIVGLPPLLGQEDWWSNVVDFVGYNVDQDSPPWQHSHVLCSALWNRLVLRNNQGFLIKSSRVNDPSPPLHMPTQDGEPFQLRVRWKYDVPEAFGTNIIWKGQCWGCGGPKVRDELKFDCTLNQWIAYKETTLRHPSYMKADFCSKQLAEATADFRNDVDQCSLGECEIFLTTSCSLPFWQCLRDSGEGMLLMAEAGWHIQEGGEFGIRTFIG